MFQTSFLVLDSPVTDVAQLLIPTPGLLPVLCKLCMDCFFSNLKMYDFLMLESCITLNVWLHPLEQSYKYYC